MNISIILPVYSETNSLIETVRQIYNAVFGEYIYEIIIIISPRSIPESFRICEELSQQYSTIRLYTQEHNPGIGWALREAFSKASGDYILVMASDGETDPQIIPLMIAKAIETNCDIVIANRWSGGGEFEGYGLIKYIVNYLFHIILKILFSPKIKEYTYAYRLYKFQSLQGFSWKETQFPFLLEVLLRPLKRGCSVEHVPVRWSARKEGKSKNSIFQWLMYLYTALKVYLSNEKSNRNHNN